MNRLALPIVALAAAAALAYAPAPAPPPPFVDHEVAPADTEWTWPEHSENLRVLPENTTAEQLQHVMRTFTRSLGVRCGFCHVGEGDFLNWDFASDANHHKDVAREMMRMTRRINGDLLEDIEGLHVEVDGDNPMTYAVTCYTCHRGEPSPATQAPEGEGRPGGAAPAGATHGAPPAGAPPAEGHPHEHGDGHEHGDAHEHAAPPADSSHGTTHTHSDGTQHRHDG